MKARGAKEKYLKTAWGKRYIKNRLRRISRGKKKLKSEKVKTESESDNDRRHNLSRDVFVGPAAAKTQRKRWISGPRKERSRLAL